MNRNNRRWKTLLQAARGEKPPQPAEGFDAQVMREIRREGSAPSPTPASLQDQLNRLFPKLAWAAALVIIVCVASDIVLSSRGPDLTEAITHASEDWLFEEDTL